MNVLLVAAVLCASLGAVEADFIIQGGEVFDGAGGESRVADVAVKDGRIVAVGEFDVEGDPTTIDASGLIVAPGFIDLHNHSDRPIVQDETRANLNYVTQGVTTIVTGNCGGGALDVGEYFKNIDQHGAGTNVAHLIPHGTLRRSVIGGANRDPSPPELKRMIERAEQGMKDGAFGMSTGLIYTPGSFAQTDELAALAKAVAKHDGLYVSHIRGEGSRLLKSIEEALEIGRRGGLPVHVSHFKASGPSAWGLATDAIQLIKDARQSGQTATADQYPYIASSTSLGAMTIPASYRARGKLSDLLADPEEGPKLRAKIQQNLDSRGGGARLYIASYSKSRSWQGKDLATIAKQQGVTPLELVIEIQNNGGARMVNFGMKEGEVRLIMREPFVATASDGRAMVIDDTVPHPRNYGTFPRKIGHYALELGAVSLADAIRSCTGLPADILEIDDRGYLRKGCHADIVVFARDEIRDAATFEKPHQYSGGMRHVFVSGVATVEDGRPTGKLPGRAVRKAHPSNEQASP